MISMVRERTKAGVLEILGHCRGIALGTQRPETQTAARLFDSQAHRPAYLTSNPQNPQEIPHRGAELGAKRRLAGC